MKRIATNDQPILSCLLMYVRGHAFDNDILIPYQGKDICRQVTNRKKNVYNYIPCPPIHKNDNGYVHVSLYNVIEYAFLDPKYLPSPFLPLPTSTQDMIVRG